MDDGDYCCLGFTGDIFEYEFVTFLAGDIFDRHGKSKVRSSDNPEYEFIDEHREGYVP